MIRIMNKIYTLLFLLILLSSCENKLYVKEPLPFTDKPSLQILPNNINGVYIQSSCNNINTNNYPLVSYARKVSIEQVGNVLFLDFDGLGEFACDLSKNIVALRNDETGVLGNIHEKEIKVFEHDEKIYFNVDRYGYNSWEFVIIEPMDSGGIKVITSEYSKEQFNEQKYSYESRNLYESGGNLRLANLDFENFEEILNDGKLLNSCIFKKSI